MKILAIRGRNLASLYDEFELPLDASPIAEAGLFSISGPTGSGKSTLMDALCLALYGETPRFDERGKGVQPGRADDDPAALVDANDKRNLLSRGTGEGYAEVDFEAMDGRRYRARWEVRRARGRPDGRFQAVQMKLDELDGTGAWAGVEEVRRRVQALVGYSFAEFRRAVVLPQFEFRAFLDADTDTRARILERVTGTEIYARISRKAHERAAAEKVALTQLEARAGELAVLSAEERAGAEEEARSAEARRAQARAERGAAEAAVRWHDEEARLGADVTEAAAEVARAVAAAGEAEGRRRELAEVEAAQPLRGARDAVTRTGAEHGEASAKASSAARAHASAEVARGEAERLHRLAEEAQRSCLAASEALRPELERARALDVTLAELERRVAKADAARAAAQGEVSAKQAELAAIERTFGDAERLRLAAERWLGARESQRVLASDWPRWQKLLGDHAQLVAELRRGEASLAAASAALKRATARRDDLATSVATQETAFGELQARAAEALRRADERDLAEIAARLKAAAERRDRLGALRKLSEDARVTLAARDAAAADAELASRSVEGLGAERRELDRRLAIAEATVTAAREALARIDAALSLEARRAALVDGEPCPLCGSKDHPYASGAPAESARSAQAQAVADAEKVVEGVRRAAEACSAKLATTAERARGAAAARAQHAETLADACSRYAMAREAARLPEIPAEPAAAGEVLAGLEADARTACAACEGEQVDALARSREAVRTRADADRARTALDEARRNLADAEVARERASSDLSTLAEIVRGLAVRRDGVEAQLEPALAFRAGWLEAARVTPEDLARSCAAVAAAYAEQERSLREATDALAALGPRREAAATALAEREDRAGDAQAAAREEGAAFVSVRAERQALLAGRSVADAERERGDAERAAQMALEDAAQRLHAAALHVAGAVAARTEADAAVAAAAARASDAGAALAAALAARGHERARLDALLERDGAWITAERSALAALDAAVRDERTRLAERVRRLEAHAAGLPAADPDEARARVAALALDEDAALRALTGVQARLQADDANREARGALEGALAEQRVATARWAMLGELIGAHDGRELRVFAQGLTLGALLRAANHHLANLAPRYLLERVPRRDLDIQVVDGDLGNEVRGVNGLSGGESFLVSLALALGLSSLSTRRTQARTLFIDEGFGTLDRDTLEQAMAAIDQLGAGDRTVGIISHVPELHERIGVKVTLERVSAGRSRLVLPEADSRAEAPVRPRRTAS